MPEYTMSQRLRWWSLNKKRAIENTMDRWKYKIRGGYKCEKCGKIIPLPGTEYRGMVNGQPMILSYYGDSPLCSECLFEKIFDYFCFAPIRRSGLGEQFDEFTVVSVEECSWYPDQHISIRGVMPYSNPTAQHLDLDIRIGMNYWNGFTASVKAIRELLLHSGTYVTSTVRYEKGGSKYCYRGIEIPMDSPKLKVNYERNR